LEKNRSCNFVTAKLQDNYHVVSLTVSSCGSGVEAVRGKED